MYVCMYVCRSGPVQEPAYRIQRNSFQFKLSKTTKTRHDEREIAPTTLQGGNCQPLQNCSGKEHSLAELGSFPCGFHDTNRSIGARPRSPEGDPKRSTFYREQMSSRLRLQINMDRSVTNDKGQTAQPHSVNRKKPKATETTQTIYIHI